MALPEGATAVWVRHFHHDVAADELGWCRIDPIDPVEPEPPIDPARFARHIQRLGRGISAFPALFDHAVRKDLESPNEVRRSEERPAGKECGSTCNSRWPPYHNNKKSKTYK